MDALTFISDQIMYLLSMALPDANPNQIQLLLLSSVLLVVVLMIFAIMWSISTEKPALQVDTMAETDKSIAVKKSALSKKARKTAKTIKKPAKDVIRTPPKKASSKKTKAKKVVTKKKAEPKIAPPLGGKDDALTDNPLAETFIDTNSPGLDFAVDGFSFFKRETTGTKADAELISIEQEMLAIRQLYIDERITKDVYVVETRRLFEKASELNSA